MTTWKEATDKSIQELRVALAKLDHDKCQLCLGIKGGVLGNENIVDGVVVCDYCTSILIDMKKFRQNYDEAL